VGGDEEGLVLDLHLNLTSARTIVRGSEDSDEASGCLYMFLQSANGEKIGERQSDRFGCIMEMCGGIPFLMDIDTDLLISIAYTLARTNAGRLGRNFL
jgi:hypothetical protein